MSGGESEDRLRRAADVIYAGIKTVPHIAERRALADRLAADVLRTLGPDNAAEQEAFRRSVSESQGRFIAADAAAHAAPVTAGPEQDTRETLRALSDAATPGPWVATAPDEWKGKPLVVQDYDGCGEGHRFVIVESHGFRRVANTEFIAAAVNYVRAALLPSPPATTGAGDADGLGLHGPNCACGVRFGDRASSPPATDGDAADGGAR